LTPDIVGKKTVYNGSRAMVAPSPIQAAFILIASSNDTFFTKPVASLTKTGRFCITLPSLEKLSKLRDSSSRVQSN
jgi:hypothetical protein